MPTRSPCRVEQLYFLLRRKPKVRTAENLEKRCSLSLSKTQNAQPLPFLSYCPFCLQKWRRQHYSCFCLIIIKLFKNSHHVPFFHYFDTWHNLGHPFHPLSNLETCVTRLHGVGDFCCITCLSNLFYGTRHLVPRKREISTVSEFDEIRRGS